jgi:hypothetical protein
MALSLLVDINASSSAGSALGWLELGGRNTKQESRGDVSKEERVTEENKTPCREIRIIITSPDDIYKY